LGDILAVCASKLKNFTQEEYAKLHPSGNLGMKIAKVTTIMQHNLHTVEKSAPIQEILQKMTDHSNGFACVVENEKLFGIITDGDIRRFLLKGNDIQTAKAKDLCNQDPKTVQEGNYIIDAVKLITTHNIQVVVILSEGQKPIGFVSARQFKI
jgi:arabinose-5-phosphate isomerase